MAEEKKPMAITQQKESQGKEKSTTSKSHSENKLVENITITKVEG